MQVFNTPFGMVDISSELLGEYRKGLKGVMRDDTLVSIQLHKILIASMSAFREYVDERIDKRPGYLRMLSAHGDSVGRKDYYYREMYNGVYAFHDVRSWVRRHDGECETLVVCVCNPSGVNLNSSSSILVYPRQPFDNMEILYSAIGEGLGMFVVREPK